MSAASWESNDTSHRATLRTAGEFDKSSYRRKGVSKGVEAILGKHESNDSVLKVQSLVFDKEHFETQADAKKWLSENDSVDKEYDSRSGSKLDSKGISEVGIVKRLTMLQSAGGATGGITKDAGVQKPNEEQLKLINQYTRSPKSADEVAIFPVLAANDIIDRDVDRFTPDTIRGFMELQGPLSPLGKSFMVGHDYRQLPVGRIFDGEAKNIDDVEWLKLWTYMPNTEQYKSYLENVDFGIYWAVSVGVMLGAATCSVGEQHEWGWHPYVCSAGHMKGERYDPAESGTTMYDMASPTDDGVLCWRNLENPQDFYELSQVYLGAQYYAAYSDKVAGAVTKSFEAGGVDMAKGLELYESDAKIISLTASEAADLPHPFPEGSKIAVALEKGAEIEELEDGSRKFTDDEGLVWIFDANGDETCLGKEADEDEEEEDVEEEDSEDEEDEESEESEDDDDEKKSPSNVAKMWATLSSKVQAIKDYGDATDQDVLDVNSLASAETAIGDAITSIGEGDYATAYALLIAVWDIVCDAADPLLDGVRASIGAPEPEDEPTLDNVQQVADGEGEVSKTELLRAVRTAKLPANILEAAAGEGGLDDVFKATATTVHELQKEVDELRPKAVLGDTFIKELRADALHWFTMQAKDPGSDVGVNVEKIERLLDLCGTNAELIKEQRDMYRDLARAKFPEAVRRSTHPDGGVNERHEVAVAPELPVPGNLGAKRIHG